MAKVKSKTAKKKSAVKKSTVVAKLKTKSKAKANSKLKANNKLKVSSNKKAKLKLSLKAKSKTKAKSKEKTKTDYHHNYVPATENELIMNLNEDLQEAWFKIRELAAEQGEQRIYTSAKAIMFAKTICYFFVRPKKKFLETVIFLSDDRKRAGFHSVVVSTKTKYTHTFRLVHADQVEGELAQAVQQSYKECR